MSSDAAPPGAITYRAHLRLSGWLLLAVGAGAVAITWPGGYVPYDNHLWGVTIIPIAVLTIAAVVAWRSHGARPGSPGTWVTEAALDRASVYRPPGARSALTLPMILEALFLALNLIAYTVWAVTKNWTPQGVRAPTTFGIGTTLLLWGLISALLAPRTVSRRESHEGCVYLVAANAHIAGPPRLTAHDEQTLAAVTAELGDDVLLACRGLDVAYGQVQVLFDCDVEVHRGEILALLGTNGAGKSTLLRTIAGLMAPERGTILYDGADIAHLPAWEVCHRGVSYMPGGDAIFPSLTVEEHLAAAGTGARLDQAVAQQRRDEVLGLFPVLGQRRMQQAGDLSGGEAQMLAVAMALMERPTILMIDELSLGLAPLVVAQLMDVVRRLRDDGMTIVLVEQSVNVALEVADRAVFLEKGEVRFSGSGAELASRHDLLRAVFLPGSRDLDSTSTNGSQPENQDPEPVLTVTGLTKRFGGVTAVSEASFEVRRHEILGLIGANGAGKTTLLDLVSGFIPADRGSVRFLGTEMLGMPPSMRAELGLGRSFQNARLFPSLTVAENISVALNRHLWTDGLVASGLALPAMLDLDDKILRAVDELVELFGLVRFRDRPARQLSTGTRRVVEITMAVAHRPRLLLLDEPAAGIAQAEIGALAPLLRDIRSALDLSIVLVEHDIPFVTSVCDRLLALDMGSPIAEGDPRDVISDPAVISAYLGGDIAAINRSGGDAASHRSSPHPGDPPPSAEHGRHPQEHQTGSDEGHRPGVGAGGRQTPGRSSGGPGRRTGGARG